MDKNKPNKPLLEMTNVSKNFMGLKAVNNLTLTVPEFGIVGLIGPNGAGKSTCFNIITKIIACDSGSVVFDGHELHSLRPHEVARLGIGRTFQNIRLFNNLSVLDNILAPIEANSCYNIFDVLFNNNKYRTIKKKNIEKGYELLDESVGLIDRMNERSDSLPYGLQRKLEISRALALEPKILLLDEPAAGMNGTEKEELKKYIAKIRERGITILLIEHDMSFVMDICERIVVLNFGTKIAEGNPKEIQSNKAVIEAYLGENYDVTN